MAERSFLEAWSLLFSEFEFVQRYSQATRGWVAVQLRFFREHGYFMGSSAEVPPEALAYIGDQVGEDFGAHPGYDLSSDTARRQDYYAQLHLPQDAKAFVASVRTQLEEELHLLNVTLPDNDKVRLRWSGENRIGITPFVPATEPQGLVALKAEIARSWPMTGLLDVLKETAIDTGFWEVFQTSASREALPRAVKDQRLLLCLYGLGTNAGLKRVAAGVADVSYDELLHIRRRYIDPASLRAACAKVADATLAIRNPSIWGSAGTTCAADSTKFGAWDRNLMTEWHARYGGRATAGAVS